MTARSNARRTVCLLILLSSSFTDKVFVTGYPEAIPPSELRNFINNAEEFVLLNRLKQVMEKKEEIVEREKSLEDMQIMLQTMLEGKTKVDMEASNDYSIEELPSPNAIIRPQAPSDKRTPASYLSLCHFKICNMGRKRQLHK